LINVNVEDAAVGRHLFGALLLFASNIQRRGGTEQNASSRAFRLFGRGVLFCRRDSLRGGLGALGDGTLDGSGVARDGSDMASGR